MIFGVVGGYLIYLAYELFQSLRSGEATTMPRALQITVIVVFAGLGAALLVFAFRVWKKGREDHDRQPVELEETAPEPDGKDGGPDSGGA